VNLVASLKSKGRLDAVLNAAATGSATIGFDLPYTFIIVRLARRDLVWINVTSHPTRTGSHVR
jgi:hypothetical protein